MLDRYFDPMKKSRALVFVSHHSTASFTVGGWLVATRLEQEFELELQPRLMNVHHSTRSTSLLVQAATGAATIIYYLT